MTFLDDSGDCGFRLIRFNPRRTARGCAEVEIDDGANVLRLWMTAEDVDHNIDEFGPHPGLMAAKQAYRDGVEIKELRS